jgi:hypothetical protein
MVPDGAGGAVIAWNAVGGSGGFDISAQRLAANGARVWPAPRVLASVPTIAWQMGIVPDGTGGAVASWLNQFNPPTPNTLAAERVMGNGTLDAPLPISALHGIRCAPSPARAGEAITLKFKMSLPGAASVGVFDVSGRLVRSFSLEYDFGPGGLYPHFFEQTLVWDGLDGQGRQVPPAVYVIRAQVRGIGEAFARVVVTK